MDSPDELYTLRAQYYLGHYNLCVEEAKALSRRPLSAEAKIEREEFQLRAMSLLRLYDKVADAARANASPGIRAIALQAQYESPSTPAASKVAILSELQALATQQSQDSSPTAQVVAAQTFIRHGEMTREAYHCVHQGSKMEHLSLLVQIYLRMERLDLAKQTLLKMKQNDEESVLTQLCYCYVALYTGRSEALDALHVMRSLTEQYGASTMLLNLTAAAYLVAGQYAEAETVLVEASAEGEDADTLINMIVCYQHQGKVSDVETLVKKIKSVYPSHPFVQGLLRVEGAFERESVKYRLAA
mmetsp:Transcript_16794/g.31824  ORF Transcript_16794/g.31824 Transcript_16794/m.31824 type:complete len:301 (-) Transcript_16794:160-1062(-)